jgi:hypothetical protein
MGIPFQVHDRSGAIQDSAAWSACHIIPPTDRCAPYGLVSGTTYSRPEDVDKVIAWSTEGQTKRRAYHLQHLADDYPSWKGAPVRGQDQARAGDPGRAPGRAPAPGSRTRQLYENQWPGYFDDELLT